MRPLLTIGMATYQDYDGVYFTLQALRLHQDLDSVELLVIDNFGCDATRQLVEGWTGGRYLRFTEAQGTAAPRDRLFREAFGKAVLCLDSHVLLAPGAIARLKRYYRDHPRTRDLLQGPLLYDDLKTLASHFDPVWRDGMWGVWAIDPRAENPRGRPFDIPMQGLGLFSCRKTAWPGFNPHFRGFGSEEGYIHEKFRNRGARCLCLPWLRWVHRFGRPGGVPYRLDMRDRIFNYLVGHREVGLDDEPILEHFRALTAPQVVEEVAAEVDRLSPRKGSTGTARARRRAHSLPLDRVPAQPVAPDLITCLMPTFNRVPHNAVLLQEAVESFLRQDHPHKELLILNDTPGQVLECSSPGVTVFNLAERLPDLGSKIAWLIERARGNIFCRWDDDDISLPWRLSLSLQRLGNRPYWRPSNSWFHDGRLCFPENEGCCHIAGIFRREILPRIGGYPARYAEQDSEDLLFNAAAARCGAEVVEAIRPEEHFYIYRWNTASVHLSGYGTIGSGWQRRGAEAVAAGSFRIDPGWQRDYVQETRETIAALGRAKWDTVGGHFDFEPLYRGVLATLPEGAIAVEVGCWLGRSIIFLAQAAREAGRRLRLYGVENGAGIDGAALPIDTLRTNLTRCGVDRDVRLLVMDSTQAAELFANASVHFAFIDAAHNEASVRADLEAWWPRIRRGGLLAGHDYTANHPGVGKAVDAFFGVESESLRSKLSPSCWQIRKK